VTPAFVEKAPAHEHRHETVADSGPGPGRAASKRVQDAALHCIIVFRDAAVTAELDDNLHLNTLLDLWLPSTVRGTLTRARRRA